MSSAASYSSVFISPHIDDVVFSCGGALALEVQKDRVLVLDVFSDSGRRTEKRLAEEAEAARLFGYEYEALGFPDSARRDFWGEFPHRMHRFFKPKDEAILKQVREKIAAKLSCVSYEKVFFPLGVGLHIDHEICFQAAQAFPREKVFYYEDVPYTLVPGLLEARLLYLSGRLPEIPGRPTLRDIESALPAMEEHLIAGPPYASLRPGFLKKPLGALIRAFFRRRLRQVEERSKGKSEVFTAQFYKMNGFFEKKLQGVFAYESQWRDFFLSPESAREQLEGYHRSEGTFSERFWRRIG
ncbi:MAG: PIG-L family deacetylase [bacterium]